MEEDRYTNTVEDAAEFERRRAEDDPAPPCDEYEPERDDGLDPEPCPNGCGRTTDDVYGGPCSRCWEAAP